MDLAADAPSSGVAVQLLSFRSRIEAPGRGPFAWLSLQADPSLPPAGQCVVVRSPTAQAVERVAGSKSSAEPVGSVVLRQSLFPIVRSSKSP